MTLMLVELSDVCKNYYDGAWEVPVLKNIGFSIDRGEFTAVMGPSGSGKSTLLNIIGCLDQATSGTVRIGGRIVSGLGDDELSKIRAKKIGFVFQTFNLLPYLNALENVELPMSYAGIPRAVRRDRAAALLKRVGLADRLRFRPDQLSGGQKQRVAIARALANQPEILLADEPTGALDSGSGAGLMELFRELNKNGMTILMITHDISIARYARRVVTIRDGELSEGEIYGFRE